MKFLFGEVFSFISDKAGRIADILTGGSATGDGESTHGKSRLGTQATITGKDGVYEADVERINTKNSLRTFPSSEFLLEVARGRVSNHEEYNIVGFASEISTVGGTIWPENNFYTFPTTAQTLEVFSDLAADNLTGTGARVLRIFGLDSDYNEIQEDVQLNGLTVVTTSASFLRVNEAVVISIGSSEFNEGKITMRNSVDQVTLAVITPQRSVTQQAIKTIPAGKTGIFYGGFISLSKKGLLAVIRERSGQTGVVFDRLRIEIEQDRFNDDLRSPIPIPEKSDIWINAFTSAGVTAASSVLNTIKVS